MAGKTPSTKTRRSSRSFFSKSASEFDGMTVEQIEVAAIRENMKLENDAILAYDRYINALPISSKVRQGLSDIRDEEKAHIGELQQLLENEDPGEARMMEEGRGEVGSYRSGSNRTSRERTSSVFLSKHERKDSSMPRKLSASMKVKASESAQEVIDEIIFDLKWEEFYDEDEVFDFVMRRIDRCVNDDKMFSKIMNDYVDKSAISDLFMEDFMNDVMNGIGDLSQYVIDDDMDYDASSEMKKNCSIDHLYTNDMGDGGYALTFMDTDSGVEFDVYFEPEYDSEGVAEYSYELSMKTDPEDDSDMSWKTVERGETGEYDFDPETFDEYEIGEYFFDRIPQNMVDEYSEKYYDYLDRM